MQHASLEVIKRHKAFTDAQLNPHSTQSFPSSTFQQLTFRYLVRIPSSCVSPSSLRPFASPRFTILKGQVDGVYQVSYVDSREIHNSVN